MWDSHLNVICKNNLLKLFSKLTVRPMGEAVTVSTWDQLSLNLRVQMYWINTKTCLSYNYRDSLYDDAKASRGLAKLINKFSIHNLRKKEWLWIFHVFNLKKGKIKILWNMWVLNFSCFFKMAFFITSIFLWTWNIQTSRLGIY